MWKNQARVSVILSAAVAVCICCGAGCVSKPFVTAAGERRKLLWHDEFNGDKLDGKIWSRCVKGKSDWDRHMSEREDLVQVKNGALVCTGIKNSNTNDDPRPYLTGGVQSIHKGLMSKGKVEIRAKFENQKGAWPALWMLGEEPDAQGRRWPWNGEIDIMERLNSDPFVYQTVHTGWTFVKKQTRNPINGAQKLPILQNDWNVYGLEITDDALVWSINGKETFRYRKLENNPEQWPFDGPFYFLMDMQLGGSWVGKVDVETLPVNMYIDWIRVYE